MKVFCSNSVHAVGMKVFCSVLQAGMKVTDINEDFKDGIKLLVLLELLTGEKLVRT